eukprot:995253_1
MSASPNPLSETATEKKINIGHTMGYNKYINFTSKIVSLKQSDPHQINYTIFVKILINPHNQTQEVEFSYKPDEESLESVINEMIDALELNYNLHHKIIINSIQSALKTKQMKIVSVPIETHSNSNQLQNGTFIFSPLSPLQLSPRIIHRQSNAAFPDLRSNSMSDSDPNSLLKQLKFDEANSELNDINYNEEEKQDGIIPKKK